MLYLSCVIHGLSLAPCHNSSPALALCTLHTPSGMAAGRWKRDVFTLNTATMAVPKPATGASVAIPESFDKFCFVLAMGLTTRSSISIREVNNEALKWALQIPPTLFQVRIFVTATPQQDSVFGSEVTFFAFFLGLPYFSTDWADPWCWELLIAHAK